MSKWTVSNPIDYSADGDDIDRAALKTKQEFEVVTDRLNFLRTNGVDEGVAGNAEPCEWRVDNSTTPATILMRSADNTRWFTMGLLKDSFGLTAENVGGVSKDEDYPLGAIMYGAEKDMPIAANQGDFYFTKDTNRMYIRRGSTWQLFNGNSIDDIKGVRDKLLLREEVAESGPGMVPRLNAIGKGEFDITGSPDRIMDREVHVNPMPVDPNLPYGEYDELGQDQIIAYNAQERRWENRPRLDYPQSQTGGRNVAVITNGEGLVVADITGSARRIADIPVRANRVVNDDVFAYDADTQTIINKPRLEFPVSQTGGANAFVVTDGNGVANVNISGSAKAVDGVKVNAAGVANGYTLEYDANARAFKAVKGATAFRGVPLDTAGLANGDVLAYDGLNNKFTPVKKDALTEADVTVTGEPDKIVRLDHAGLIHAKFRDLEASSLSGYPISLEGEPTDGQVLTWRPNQGGWKAEDPDVPIGNGRSLVLRSGNDLLFQYNGMSAVEYDISKLVIENNIDFTPYAQNTELKKYIRYVTQGSDGGSFTVTSADSSTSKTIRISKVEYATRALADKDGNHLDTDYAKLAGAAFTGNVTAPKPALNDDSGNVATTSWVNEVIATNVNLHGGQTVQGVIETLQQQVADLTATVSRLQTQLNSISH